MVGQLEGFLEIIQLSTLQVLFSKQIPNLSFLDICKTSTANEYAFGFESEGLGFGILKQGGDGKFKFRLKTDEKYLMGENVQAIAVIRKEMIVACVHT